MVKVSVIIPVYNVESYLRECLDSVINQTLKEIEIICIDDCSTDSSYSILEEYANKDNRVKIFKNYKNESVGYNRNIGMKEAKGEYISFIDSDDFISKDFLYNLYNTAKKYNSDIVNTLNIYRYRDNKLKKIFYSFKKTEFESAACLQDIENISSYKAIAPYSVNKLYRRSFLEDINLKFITTKLGAAEDTNFIIKLMLNKPSISFNNRSIYYYRYTPLSLTNIVNENIDSIRNCIFNMYDVISYCKNNFPDSLDKIYHKTWFPIFNFYSGSSDDIKRDSYKDIFDFANYININPNLINKNSKHEQYAYNEYCAIIASYNYNDYLFNSFKLRNINDIEENININNNWLQIFSIYNNSNYFNIMIFGIRISIKKK